MSLEDKNTNNPSLIEVTERITFSGKLAGQRRVDLPFPAPYSLVSLWQREDKDDSIKELSRVRFISPEEESLLSIEYEIDLDVYEKIRINGRFGSLPFTVNGTYEFEVSYEKSGEWIHAASIPLEIIREEPDRESSEPGT